MLALVLILVNGEPRIHIQEKDWSSFCFGWGNLAQGSATNARALQPADDVSHEIARQRVKISSDLPQNLGIQLTD